MSFRTSLKQAGALRRRFTELDELSRTFGSLRDEHLGIFGRRYNLSAAPSVHNWGLRDNDSCPPGRARCALNGKRMSLRRDRQGSKYATAQPQLDGLGGKIDPMH